MPFFGHSTNLDILKWNGSNHEQTQTTRRTGPLYCGLDFTTHNYGGDGIITDTHDTILIPMVPSPNFADVKAFCDEHNHKHPNLEFKPKFILDSTQEKYEKWIKDNGKSN